MTETDDYYDNDTDDSDGDDDAYCRITLVKKFLSDSNEFANGWWVWSRVEIQMS